MSFSGAPYNLLKENKKTPLPSRYVNLYDKGNQKGGIVTLKIKEAANRLNTTPRAIRFYEEKGLIEPEKGENDYRHYNDQHLWKLQTILALREVGMSTSQIKSTLQDDKEVSKYLNLQRSALYEEWLEIKDMITTIDQMLNKQQNTTLSTQDIFKLADHLKDMKQKRKSWDDQWNFNEQAHDYDTSLKMNGYRFNVHEFYNEALAKAVQYVSPQPGEQGVDIGTGTGNLASLCLEKGASMIGVDQSEEMLNQCAKKFPSIDTRHGHFLALPVMDNQANFIVSSYALHHVTDDEKVMALQEMDRVLQSGGRIAITDLMFLNKEHKQATMKKYEEAGNDEAIYAINDEYYADQSILLNWFEENNYHYETHMFSDILHVVYAKKR